MKRKIITFILSLVAITSLNAKDYNASLFGIRSNGTTSNTRAIQKAIDHIHENGGGRLVFYVGRYLTGSVTLKSNVHIVLNEGAVLVGSTNPYDYDQVGGWYGLIIAKGAENISITGKGVLDGRGRELAYNYGDQIQKGIIKDDMKYDRAAVRPTLVYLRECTNVNIEGIYLKDACFWVQIYDQCKNLTIDKITVNSTAFWNNDGIDIVDCENVKLTNSFIDAADDAICLKSHDQNKMNKDIIIDNCVARSSASGVKFGTASNGGFVNVKLTNIKVYDTYRSAFTLQAVDGGTFENITIDGLKSYNTANVIFLRIGERREGRKAKLNNVTIANVYAEVPESKQPDMGYDYDGPIEDEPRNTSPCGIVGLPGQYITNVTMKNIEIVYPGGGNPNYAKVGTSAKELDAIPEMPKAYPEFSQFKELPAWGFYIRHAKDITFENVTLKAEKRDYRPAVVLDDVIGADLSGLKFEEPGGGKKQIIEYKSSKIKK